MKKFKMFRPRFLKTFLLSFTSLKMQGNSHNDKFLVEKKDLFINNTLLQLAATGKVFSTNFLLDTKVQNSVS